MDIALTRDGDGAVLTWNEGENRINHESLARLHEILDELWPVFTNRLPRATALHAVTTAHRFVGPEALARGIADELAGEDQVLARAVEVAQAASSIDKKALRYHKR